MGQTYDKEFVEILRKYAKEELKKQPDCKVVSSFFHRCDHVYSRDFHYEQYENAEVFFQKCFARVLENADRLPEIEEKKVVDCLREYLYKKYNKRYEKFSKIKIRQCDMEMILGDNKKIIGIFTKTQYNGSEYFSDRLISLTKLTYTYWSIGHLIEEGYVVANESINYDKINNRIMLSGVRYRKKDNQDVIQYLREFYNKFSTGSKYEPEVIDNYLKYLSGLNEENMMKTPLLLREVRLRKNEEVYHQGRLDFLILNYHTGERLGIEISPSSTHADMGKEKYLDYRKKMRDFYNLYDLKTLEYTENDILTEENIQIEIENALHIKELKKEKTSTEVVEEYTAKKDFEIFYLESQETIQEFRKILTQYGIKDESDTNWNDLIMKNSLINQIVENLCREMKKTIKGKTIRSITGKFVRTFFYHYNIYNNLNKEYNSVVAFRGTVDNAFLIYIHNNIIIELNEINELILCAEQKYAM